MTHRIHRWKKGRRNEKWRINAGELFVATLVISLLSLALPLMTLQVYDRILPYPGSGTFPVLIGGLCVALVLEIFVRLARARVISWNGACYEHRTACHAMARMLRADLGRFESLGAGEHLNGLSAIHRLKDFNNGQSHVTLFELVLLPVYLGLIFYIAGDLILVPLAVLTAFCILSLLFGMRLRDALQRRDDADDRRYDFLIEVLEGIHTLKAFALEDRFQRRYEAMERDTTAASYVVTDDSARVFNMATVFSHVMMVAVITAGALDVLAGQISSGALIATILLSGRIMQPVQRAVSLWVRYQDSRTAQERLSRLLSLPQVRQLAAHDMPDRQGRLEIRDVSYRYEGAEAPLFSRVNLSLSRGETVRISGAHGCGKTTLLRMIAGLYEPTEGVIHVDGLPVLDYPASERIRHTALLPTHGTIFRGTIRDNITRFGAVPEREARDVSMLLGIDADVAALARGFDTMLEGTETDIIAPGLRQRIALARALASKPRVIVFDNADRNLDRDGYRQVYRLLARLREKVALVIVSDDRNIMRLADRHYVLGAEGLTPVDEGSVSFRYGGLRA